MPRKSSPPSDTRPNKFDVAKQWTAGYIVGLTPGAYEQNQSPHWQAGWNAGYASRAHKNIDLNKYLASIGCETMHTVSLQ